MYEFIKVYDSLPALDMLCDIEVKNNKVKSNVLKGRLQIVKDSAYLIWMQEPVTSERVRTAIPPNLITAWRYNENSSKEEIIKSFT